MGAGRKTETFYGTSGEFSCSTNKPSGITFRGLEKSILVALYSGAHPIQWMSAWRRTYLVGLPACHLSYIKNVTVGMPVFLFNYTKRTLHGIFRAQCNGQMNIDPYGWTAKGSETTRFPAQVLVAVELECQAIHEKEFKPIIQRNYYRSSHFWFELDHGQVKDLISLFKAYAPSTSRLSEFSDRIDAALRSKGKNKAILDDHNDAAETLRREIIESSELEDWEVCSSRKPSCDNYEDGNTTDQGNAEGKMVIEGIILESSSVTSKVYMDGPSQAAGLDTTFPDPKESSYAEQSVKHFGQTAESTRDWVDHVDDALKWNSSVEDGKPQNGPAVSMPELNVQPVPIFGIQKLNQKVLEQDQRIRVLEEKQIKSLMIIEHLQQQVKALSSKQEVSSLTERRTSNIINGEQNKSARESIFKVGENDWLSEICTHSGDELSPLELFSSEMEVSSLIERSTSNVFEEQNVDLYETIFIVKGNDGKTWLSNFEAYSPARDKLFPLEPMLSPRSFSAVTSLNNILYVIGGHNGKFWFNAVESYNPRYNTWSTCPSLTREKGCLAGAALQGKIFVFGGCGKEPFVDVEMYDPCIGRWLVIGTLLQERYFHSAVDCNGAVYVVGGRNRQSYLQTVERYDPRETSCVQLRDMSTRRAYHCLAVLNENIYAFGGYDGKQFLSSMEVFDPRAGTWRMADSMKKRRGFAAAAVLGDGIYVTGGLMETGAGLKDTVECFKDREGWNIIECTSLANLRFHSAAVIRP